MRILRARKADALGLAAIALFIVWLNPPILLRIFTEYDNYIYAGVARGMERGLMPYSGVFDQKLPALYLTFYGLIRAFGDSPLPIQILYLLCTLGLGLCLYSLCRRMGAGAALSSGAVLLMLSWPIRLTRDIGYLSSLQVWFNNTGLILAFIQSVCLLLALGARPAIWWTLIGILVGWSAWIKPQEALFALALAAWVWWSPSHRDRRLPCLGYAAAGFLAVSAVMLAWMAHHSLFPAFAEAMRYNAHYVSDTSLLLGVGWAWGMVRCGPEPLVFGTLAALAVAWARRADRNGKSEVTLLVILWLAYGVISIVLGRRSFIHSLLPLMCAGAVLTAGIAGEFIVWLESRLDTRARSAVWAGTAAVVAFTVLAGMNTRLYRNLSFWAHSLRPFDLKGEWAVDAWHPQNTKIGLWLKSHSRPDDRVFVYGPSSVQVLYESGLTPATRFIWYWPLDGHYGGSFKRQPPELTRRYWGQWLSDMRRSQPPIILDETGRLVKAAEGRSDNAVPPQAAAYIARHYRADGRIYGMSILRRSAAGPRAANASPAVSAWAESSRSAP